MPIHHRPLIYIFLSFFLLAPLSCTSVKKQETTPVHESADGILFGRLAIVQGPTSDKETLINIVAPRLKNYNYEVQDQNGVAATVEKYDTVTAPVVLYKIDKIMVRGLNPKSTYTLKILSEFRGHTSLADQREFHTLDIQKKEVTFAAISCMADDWKFEQVIDPMWARLKKENPDLVILNGDIVYVDDFDFVERKKATETDLWLRYLQSLHRLPYYHWYNLKPTLATWDDHDFGTNDGDRTFKAKAAAKKLFIGLFGGKSLPGVWEPEPSGVTSMYKGFGQRFYLMDDRTFRQPNKGQKTHETYGHWGEKQHKWLLQSLKQENTPAWIFNGNQVFNGKSLDFKEAFEANHATHFVKFIEDIKNISAPIVFSSGDVHFSEVMRIPTARLGYETYEITSSSMHSYRGSGWDNPMRIEGAYTREYNFLTVDSRVIDHGLELKVESYGLAPEKYFSTNLKVQK
ncbi:MAG: hypothetical protein H6623_04175 [Bdellovibrionaceae bacterium]|nr:hypothetical protein [Pseudobdellovibrionaceae bacterium]